LLRPIIYGVSAVLLASALDTYPVLASSVIVPDEYSAVQSAIDSGADTVLIREGTYAERPVVDRPVVLQGIGVKQRPRLIGLHIYNSNFWATPRLMSVSGVHIAGRVAYETLYIHPRLLNLIFSECTLDSGLQVSNLDTDDVALLSVRNCRMGGTSRGQVDQLFMEADTVDGGVAWRVSLAYVRDCWFRGGPGRAIELTGYPKGGPAARNRIEYYETGIYVENSEHYRLEENTILRCGTGMQIRNGSEVVVTRNRIQECDIGVDIAQPDGLLFRQNTIIGALYSGAILGTVGGYWGLVVEENVVGGCRGDGIVIPFPVAPQVNRVRWNTIFDNGGNGVTLTNTGEYPIAIEGNIVSSNTGWGLAVPAGTRIALGCNDWFGNGLGSVDGVTPGATDLNVDPLFCDVDSADVRLDSGSPLVDAGGCGQIGALGVGCGVTATLVQRFTAGRVSEGVRVVWEVGEGATASEVWLERSEGVDGESWIRPLTERSMENRAVVELDGSAVSDRAYSYRLVAREGSVATVIGPPILVGAQARPDFRLVEVGPNPGSGPVRIAFALKHAGAIEIDVFDVQGRRVASPGAGVWPAGMHVVEWNGRTHSGEVAPSGLYLLRYAYPGGQDRRRIVRTR
jgi:parallel beta-helix repeat protein